MKYPLLILFLVLASLPVYAAVNAAVTSPVDGALLAGNEEIGITFDGTANVTIEYNTSVGTYESLNASTGEASPYSFSWQTANGSFPDGAYGLRVTVTNATDAADEDVLLVQDLTIDNTPPAVSGVSANETYLRSDASLRLEATVTDATTSVDAVNASNSLTVAMPLVSGTLYRADTTPASLGCTSEGTCTITVSANDSLGNVNGSLTITVTVDDTNPAVTSAATNDSAAGPDESVRITVTATDANLSSITVGNSSTVAMNVAGGSTYEANTTYTSLGCAAGSCLLRFTATDAAGNTNDTESLQVVADGTAPNLTLNAPANATSTNNQTVLFNWTSTDAVDSDLTCTLYLNGTANETSTGSGEFTATKTLAESTQSWYVTCADDTPNNATSSTRSITIDLTDPVLSQSSGSITSSSATIASTADESVTFTIYYGTTSGSLTQTASGGTGTTASTALSSLSASTAYYFATQGCDAAGNCANTSESSLTTSSASSGGGGGGGGGTPALSRTGSAVTLTPKFGRYTFQHDRIVHYVRVSEITDEHATIVFTSDPVEVQLGIGESENIDITGDAVPDVYVEVISLAETSVRFILGTARTEDDGQETGTPPPQDTGTAGEDLSAIPPSETLAGDFLGEAESTAPGSAPAQPEDESGTQAEASNNTRSITAPAVIGSLLILIVVGSLIAWLRKK